MSRAIEPLKGPAKQDVAQPLFRSRLAVYCLFAFCVLIAGLSIVGFVFQVLLRDEFGELYRNQPGAWPHILGHLLRSAVGAWLAWCLLSYLRALNESIGDSAHGTLDLYRTLARWWNGLAISVIVLVLHGVWVAFIVGPPIVTRPLSPRFQAKAPDESAVKIEFRLAESSPREGLVEAVVAGTSRKIFLHVEPFITNEDISDARVVMGDRNQPAVEVRFITASRQKVREATGAHRGRPLAILVDGRVVTAPIVQWQIGESAWIQGSFSREEAERIARGLSGRK